MTLPPLDLDLAIAQRRASVRRPRARLGVAGRSRRCAVGSAAPADQPDSACEPVLNSGILGPRDRIASFYPRSGIAESDVRWPARINLDICLLC